MQFFSKDKVYYMNGIGRATREYLKVHDFEC